MSRELLNRNIEEAELLDPSDENRKAREQAIIDAYRPICLCNKIRKGIILKAIRAGAKTFDMVSRRTGVGTGPCGAARCGPMIRGMLGQEVETCTECGWSILKTPLPLTCPRCGAEQ
jgi:bacterioferritin-associated ferredoxin